jgi:prepilin-type processing-associated H-X9-DG protein
MGKGFKLNVLFFDGHAVTMDESDAVNPALWLPKGTSLSPSSTFSAGAQVVWPDVAAKYGTAPYVIP